MPVQIIPRLLIAALALAAVSYILLAGIGDPADESALIETAAQREAGSDAVPATVPHEPALILLGDPTPLSVIRAPAFAASGDSHLGPTTSSGSETAATANTDEVTAGLQRLAAASMAQLYTVLWQALDVGDPDDYDFRDFVLATLEERGDHAPGEVLAALVQTAATPELRQEALRLLAEASQELSAGPIRRALGDPDPAIQESALAFFDELGAKALLDAVAGAVLDSNREVRLVAFSTLEDMSEIAPVWEVAALVLDDPDPLIRKRALELLTYGDPQSAIHRLELALGDPDFEIAELAEALLAELEQESS